MNSLLRLNLLLLLAVAIFDPSDLLFHAKVPVFVGVWILLVMDIVISRGGRYQVPENLYLYIFIFAVLLPLVGLLTYVLRGGGMEGYEGFRYLKSYLFLTLSIPLAIKRIDLIRPLSLVLSVLSVATIFSYAITINDEIFKAQLAAFGDAFVIFSLTDRSYGGLSYQSLYFHASPLLVIPIVYFCYQFLNTRNWSKLWNGLFLGINICGMVLSGTRNNMIVGLFAPLLVIAWYKGVKTRLVIAVLLMLAVVAGLSLGIVQAMFSADEYSNAVKLGHVHDYGLLFSDWRTVVFGQGLGAGFFSTAWGTRVTLTELTYLEIIRNYGIFLASILFFLIFYPLRMLANPKARADHYLFLGYACYLYLCTGNPILLSSTGMLVLAVVLLRTFCNSAGVAWRVPVVNLGMPRAGNYTRATG